MDLEEHPGLTTYVENTVDQSITVNRKSALAHESMTNYQ
jgi:hypothetical protein